MPDGVSEFWIYSVYAYGKFYLKDDIQRFRHGKFTSLLAPKTFKLSLRKSAQFLFLHASLTQIFSEGGEWWGGGFNQKKVRIERNSGFLMVRISQ